MKDGTVRNNEIKGERVLERQRERDKKRKGRERDKRGRERDKKRKGRERERNRQKETESTNLDARCMWQHSEILKKSGPAKK